MLELDHPDVSLGLVVRIVHVEIGRETQYVVAVFVKAIEQIDGLGGGCPKLCVSCAKANMGKACIGKEV